MASLTALPGHRRRLAERQRELLLRQQHPPQQQQVPGSWQNMLANAGWAVLPGTAALPQWFVGGHAPAAMPPTAAVTPWLMQQQGLPHLGFSMPGMPAQQLQGVPPLQQPPAMMPLGWYSLLTPQQGFAPPGVPMAVSGATAASAAAGSGEPWFQPMQIGAPTPYPFQPLRGAAAAVAAAPAARLFDGGHFGLMPVSAMGGGAPPLAVFPGLPHHQQANAAAAFPGDIATAMGQGASMVAAHSFSA